jgi:ATP-binding cassette subfamily C (CFTR/MRP) protein 1
MLSALLMSWASIENGTVGLQRIHEIVELAPEEDPKASVTSLPKDSPWPTQGSVVFEDFGMRYK